MADRKGKARAWSAKRAAALLEVAHGSETCDGFPPDCAAIDERHLTKAYLCGWQAALNSDDPIGDHEREQARLGMSPQAKRKGKSGEGR